MLPESTNRSPLPTPRKPRPDVPSHQYVIGICIALFVAVVCFMCGILLGRWQRNIELRAEAPQTQETTVVSEEAAAPRKPEEEEAPRRGEGIQAYPRPVVLPAAPPEAQVSSPFTVQPRPLQEPEVVVTDLEEPATVVQREIPLPEAHEAPVPPVSPALPTPPEPPAQPEEPAEEAPAHEPAVPEEAAEPAKPPPPAEFVPLPQSPPPARAPKQPEATPGQGKYGVQVASFLGPKRLQAAEAYKQRLEAQSDLKAVLAPCSDPLCVRVIVGGYADRKAAATACKELRKRPGFEDCFVKPLR